MAVINPPKLPSLLLNKGPKGGYYVYTYQNIWDADKKRSRRANSKKVGVILNGGKEGLIKWDEHFIKDYPELEHLDVFREGRKYVFKAKEPQINSLDFYKNTKIYHAGATFALDYIVSQSNIGKALSRVFFKYNDYLKILSIAYYLILCKNNKISQFEEFSECTRLPYQRVLSPSSIYRLFERIDEEKVDRFIEIMNDYYFKNRDENDYVYLAFDSTSISTYSPNLRFADFGKNKDGDDLYQYNVLMLVEQDSGIPLFYRAYNGAVPDIVTLRRTIADATRLKFNKNIVFVCDKGYPSASNIDDCLRNNISFVFNMRTNIKNCLIQQEIDEAYNRLISRASFNKKLNQHVYTVKLKWKYASTLVEGKNRRFDEEKELFLHFYYDPDLRFSSEKAINYNAATVCELLNDGFELTNNIHKTIKDRYLESIKDDCGNDIWVISDILVEKNLKYRGIRALLSDCEKDPCVCYQRYYDRAEVEYAFNTLKYRLACNRPRCHKDKSLSGRLFTQFIATTLSIMVRKRLQKYKKAVKNKVIKGKIIYSSDGKLLSSLNNILVKVTPEGNLYDEVVGKKADYFIALGIPLPSSTPQGFDPLSGLMDEQEAENDLDKLDPILDGLYYEEI